MQFRIGNGFDVHQLVEGRKLILGGVEVAHSKGLLGHSDADVLLHAISDAMLGALALGDIGVWFPDTKSENKDIDSTVILSDIFKKISAKDWKISNIDSTIIAQEPKLSPYIPLMQKRISEVLSIETSQIGIKATTSEKLGFVGRGEGIACMSSILICKN